MTADVRALRTRKGTNARAYLRELAEREDLDGILFCYTTKDGQSYNVGWINMQFEDCVLGLWHMRRDIEDHEG